MKKMLLVVALVSYTMATFAQLSMDVLGETYVIDFSGFAGAGFSPAPDDGQLDSDTWSVTGLSDGDLDFGATGTTGDYARGATTGFVTSGGVYAADVLGNQALLVQPTADDFTPGSFVLRAINNTASVIGELEVFYTLYINNDQARSSSYNFSYSYDNETWIDIADLDYTSAEAPTPIPTTEDRETTLIGLTWGAGEFFYLRWTGDDVGGSGSRDEIALDDITLTPDAGAPAIAAGFSGTSLTANEADGSVSISVTLTGEADCTLNIAVDAASTADNGTDYSLSDPTAVSFTIGSGTSEMINIPITDDLEVEDDESVILLLSVTSGACVLGAADELEITIIDNDEPVATEVDIADVTGEDADGVAISDGELVTMTGVVYGYNLRVDGLEFTLIDATAGIKVFSFSESFGYTPNEGDEVRITGFITQFNGLTEIEPEELELLSTGNPLKVPTTVTNLGEPTESDLVTFSGTCSVVDPAQWLGDGSSFNVDLDCGGTPVQMRIDAQVDLANLPLPDTILGVTGIGGQFDASAPYLEGYQILPRYAADLVAQVVSVNDNPNPVFRTYPNPAAAVLQIEAAAWDAIHILDLQGKLIWTQGAGVQATQIDVTQWPAGNYLIQVSYQGKSSTANLQVN